MKLGFGLMRLPVIDGNRENIDYSRFRVMADRFIAAGGTYFDTAYPYHGGFSEVALRENVVKRYPRDSFTVTDKLPLWLLDGPEAPERIFELQLERCGVDHFDYYWLHAVGDDNYAKIVDSDAYSFIRRMRDAGKIRHIGFSFHGSMPLLEKMFSTYREMEYVQLQINYMDMEDPSVRGRESLELAKSYGLPVIVMEPVKGGSLAKLPPAAEKLFRDRDPSMSPASWAVRYAASFENVYMVLSGMSTPEQVEDNVSYMQDFKPLDASEYELIDRVIESIKTTDAIPCTGCSYCVTEQECPAGIKIPELFGVYNRLGRYLIGRREAKEQYSGITSEGGRAADCIACGGCEDHCPQHLEIRELLRTVSAKFDR
ncbi:MAG: aldo/keto reductase [Clostridia bacterium]|nr:aldo/keto reductase [Clostridia bacterium]